MSCVSSDLASSNLLSFGALMTIFSECAGVYLFTMIVARSWAVLAHVKRSSLSVAQLSGLPGPSSTYLT